jgi:hypothetical protein
MIEFIFGLRGGIFATSIPGPASTASTAPGELPGPVPDQEPELVSPLA